MNLATAALGALIGILSGISLRLLIVEASRPSSSSGVLPILAQLIALPVFWFGGYWATGRVVPQLSSDATATSSYLGALAVTFALVAFPSVFKLVDTVNRLMTSGMHDEPESRKR